MTSFRNLVTSVCAVCVLAVSAKSSQADWTPGVHMAESMLLNLAIGKTIEDRSDFGFCSTCYLGAYIAPGNNSFLTTQLERGRQYVFTGAVQEGCDLDIIIEDSDGDVVAKDTQSDNFPIVRFTPRYTGSYTIRLKLYAASASKFCSIVLLQKGGWSIPYENLGAACGTVLNRCRRVASLTSARFLQEPGEWAVIGQVMREGETTAFSDMRLGTGRRVVVAGGDAKSRDLDLAAYRDSSSMIRLAADTQSDNNPTVELNTSRSNRYAVGIANARSNGPTVVMTAILDVD